MDNPNNCKAWGGAHLLGEPNPLAAIIPKHDYGRGAHLYRGGAGGCGDRNGGLAWPLGLWAAAKPGLVIEIISRGEWI